jgi:ABC-type antimicrobial peptide transport system permease subunit
MRINGFPVRETIGYVLRETVVTTAAGILLGVGLGTVIGYKIVCSLEQSFVQFDRRPSVVAWIVGALMTIAFTVIVNAIALKKVRKLKLTDAA